MEDKNSKTADRPTDENLRAEYNKAAENWRHLNNILWGIPAVAVSIMTGMVVAAYQPSMIGWPRFILLSFGSLFLFAISAEVVKKQLHMNIATHLSSKLQDELELKKFKTPPHVLEYWRIEANKKDREKYAGEFSLSHLFFGRGEGQGMIPRGPSVLLAYVILVAAISIAVIAVLDLVGIIVKYYHISLTFELP